MANTAGIQLARDLRSAPARCVAAAAVLLLAAAFGTIASDPAIAAEPTAIAINATTSPLDLWEPFPDDGALAGYPNLYPTTTLSGVITNCPAGDYVRDLTLVQDGYSAWWTGWGLGSARLVLHRRTASHRDGLLQHQSPPAPRPGNRNDHPAGAEATNRLQPAP